MIHDAECAEAVRTKLREFPVVGVEVENSSHCHLIQNFVHEALLECFPMSKVRKRKSILLIVLSNASRKAVLCASLCTG